MNKLGLSVAVIAAFIVYSWHQQEEAAQAPVLHIPTQSKDNTTASVPTATSGIALSPTSGGTPPSIPAATPITRNTSPYKDGTYTGSVADAFYGNIQVQVSIANGKITNIQFLQYPNDRGTSIMINQQADPMLAQEAIQAQSAQVDIVSGATDSSQAFVQSMQSALDQAKA